MKNDQIDEALCVLLVLVVITSLTWAAFSLSRYLFS